MAGTPESLIQTESGFVPEIIVRGASILSKLERQLYRNPDAEAEIANVFTQLVKRQSPFYRYGLDIESSVPWISFSQDSADAELLKARAHFESFTKGVVGGLVEHKEKWMLGVIVPSRYMLFYIPVEGLKSVKRHSDIGLLISEVEGEGNVPFAE